MEVRIPFSHSLCSLNSLDILLFHRYAHEIRIEKPEGVVRTIRHRRKAESDPLCHKNYL